jgi:hypothetical protein
VAWVDIRLARGLAASLLLLPAIAEADVLVVRAVGPSAGAYPAGRTLPDNAKLTLRTGDQITLLDDRGTRSLRGPGSFAAAGGAAAQGGTALAALVGQRSERRARIGAVRNVTADETPASTRRPNIFVVDVGQTGATCLADPKSVTLWRSETNAVGTTTVTGSAGASARLNWGRGQSTQAWPAALPVTDGASYQFAGPGKTATVRLKLLKTQPSGLRDMASMLIAADCKAQLDALIATAGGTG